jgi:serine/threonine protein kinase
VDSREADREGLLPPFLPKMIGQGISTGTQTKSKDQVNNKEVDDVRHKIKQNRQQMKLMQAKIDQHVQKIIEQKFEPSLLDTLERLEEDEVELLKLDIELRKQLVEVIQNHRRELLREAQGLDVADHDVLSKSGSKDGETAVSGRMGKASSVLRSRKTNPFLVASEQEYVAEASKELSQAELFLERNEIEIFTSTSELGHGSYGSVYEGRFRGQRVAVKVINPKFSADKDIAEILATFKNECIIMRKLAHPNVLMLMGVCVTELPQGPELLMVTQLMERGSVASLIHDPNPQNRVPFKRRLRFARDTALALNCMHLSKPPILHLDLKPQNILVDKNWVAHVADFGLSRVMLASMDKGTAGSPIYMAPEVLANKPFGMKADIYSFGIVLWELITNQTPYAEQKFADLGEVYQHVVLDGKRPPIPPRCPTALARLLLQCWDYDPDKRPTVQQILDSHALNDDTIVDAVISDTNSYARDFWKQEFKEKDEEVMDTVPWRTFAPALFKFCGYQFVDKTKPFNEQLEVKALKHICVNTKDESVTIEWFSKVLEWFGPFTRDQKFIKNVLKIISIKGFFGDIPKDLAIEKLAGKKSGTYLIRYSNEAPGFMAITVVSPDADPPVRHYRIQHKAGLGYVLGKTEYKSLTALIKSNKEDLGLEHPLSGSVFYQMLKAYNEHLEDSYHVFVPGQVGTPKPSEHTLHRHHSRGVSESDAHHHHHHRHHSKGGADDRESDDGHHHHHRHHSKGGKE